MGDVVLYLEELEAASTIASCRICHELELESCKSLEAPCACSGTVKYAHRDCIQRWCDQKGNTVCEICLQKFEPGYTAAPKISQLVGAAATIRGSLEVPRRGRELQNPTVVIVAYGREERMIQTNNSECSSAADRSANFCKSMALLFTVVLLARHLLAVLTRRPEDYPFTLAAVLIIKASGIIVPMLAFIRLITAVQNSIKHRYQEPNESSDDETENNAEEEDYEEHVHHRVEVQS